MPLAYHVGWTGLCPPAPCLALATRSMATKKPKSTVTVNLQQLECYRRKQSVKTELVQAVHDEVSALHLKGNVKATA